jgi:Bacterial Ig-like domain (group 2)/Bacterial SH3 domain
MKRYSIGLFARPLALAVLACAASAPAACGGGGANSAVPAFPPVPPGATSAPVLQATLVYTSDQSVILSQPGQTYDFRVGLAQPNGTTLPVVNGVSWQSLNTAVATVDQTGKVTVTGAAGSANIVATLNGYDPAYGSVIVAHATSQTVQVASSLVKSATPTSAVLVRNAQTQAVVPGNIVVSNSAGGLFGQVTGVTMDASTVTLSLQPATIPDAFPDYSYKWNGPPVQLDIQSLPGGRYTVRDKRGRVVSEGSFDFPCSGGTASEKPGFEHPITITAILNFDARQHLIQVGTELSGSIGYSGGMYTVGGAGNPLTCETAITLNSHVQIALPGGLLTASPVVTPRIGIEIISDRQATVKGPSAKIEFDVLSGFQYQNGQWSLLESHAAPALSLSLLPTVSFDGPLEAHITPYFRADVGFDVCPFVCVTQPFNNTILNANVAYGKIFSPYDLSFAGPTNELTQGYRGPMFSTNTQVDAGLELALDFGALDKLLNYLKIPKLDLEGKQFHRASSTFVAPLIRVSAGTASAKIGEAVTLTATATNATASGVRFVGFRDEAANGTVLASSSLNGGGVASATWVPSVAGRYTIVALVDNLVGPATASANSADVTVASGSNGSPPPSTPPPSTPPPSTPPPSTPPPTTPPPATPPPSTPPPQTKSATVANTGGVGLKLHSSPGVDAPLITTMPEGTQVTVLGGPTVTDGFTWWNVRTTIGGTQYTGWSGIGEWLAPPPSVGAVVTVSNTSGIGLNLHSAPSRSATVVKALPEGTQMTVIGGPTYAEGYTWWNLRGNVGGSQYTGWSATGDWLVPNPRY